VAKKSSVKGKRVAGSARSGARTSPRASGTGLGGATSAAAAAKACRLAIDAAQVAHLDKCEDILVYDVRTLSSICDYMVIATGTSDRQMRAVADHIESAARRLGDKPFRTAGIQQASWIVLDFVDVVIHLFDPDARRYYDLELLWGDAPQVKWQSGARSAAPAAG